MDTTPDYRFQPVSGHAAVEGVWSLETGPGEDRIAPDTCCEIIFHLAEPPLERLPSGWRRQAPALLYGPLTRVLGLKFDGPMKLHAIRLKPGGIGELANDPPSLRNASHELASVMGSETASKLQAAAHRGLPALQTAAAALPHDSPSRRSGRIAGAAQLLAAAPGLTARRLAAELGISIRTLDRTFLAQTGLRPGEYLRIHRYHAARRAVSAGAANLADIAADHGYADQAHMTREFRHFSGLTPRRKRAGEGHDLYYDN
ncbi:helix-turn-helix domain-containing protein [Hyphobacterium sp.]|jgi:AraC-like DNA-binding protein|uniref:helix-turn-helix domain-containing protein n=1 Tax=Hyphobacterium sp. TaxID=2004662 RepID=UPI003BA9DE15